MKKVADALMQERSEYGNFGGTGNIAKKRGRRHERKFEPWQLHNDPIVEQTFAGYIA